MLHLGLENQIEDRFQGILAIRIVAGHQDRQISKKLRGKELHKKKSFYLLSMCV